MTLGITLTRTLPPRPSREDEVILLLRNEVPIDCYSDENSSITTLTTEYQNQLNNDITNDMRAQRIVLRTTTTRKKDIIYPPSSVGVIDDRQIGVGMECESTRNTNYSLSPLGMVIEAPIMARMQMMKTLTSQHGPILICEAEEEDGDDGPLANDFSEDNPAADDNNDDDDDATMAMDIVSDLGDSSIIMRRCFDLLVENNIRDAEDDSSPTAAGEDTKPEEIAGAKLLQTSSSFVQESNCHCGQNTMTATTTPEGMIIHVPSLDR